MLRLAYNQSVFEKVGGFASASKLTTGEIRLLPVAIVFIFGALGYN